VSSLIVLGIIGIVFLILVLPSIRVIGPTEVGLVTKRFGRKLSPDNPVALEGEAGYQADLLMPGWRFKFWVVYDVEKHPWVQIPAGKIGVVVAQVGKPLPIGAKSAKYEREINIKDVRSFMGGVEAEREGKKVIVFGQKGVQRPVLSPGTLLPLHPIAFLVITSERCYGKPIDPDLRECYHKGSLNCEDFGLKQEWLDVRIIKPEFRGEGKIVDMVGIITTLEGDPLPPGDIAGRLEGFKDIADAMAGGKGDSDLIELIIGSKNQKHNNYQDFQAFLDNGGKIGLQHDPLLYGAYNLNPFLIKVEAEPMLVVEQGEVAVVKSYVGLPTEAGKVGEEEFKFGTIVRPGHRGIWNEALVTGKYAINPHCYQWEKVPVSIINLNWAEGSLKAYEWESQLSPIDAKSREGFIFHIDLQVQIHIAAKEAPAVISMVGTMANLTNQVLQPAVGNHFRDKLQSMPAVMFIETRQLVQREAQAHITSELEKYHIETRGVYIQNVILPEKLVEVLTNREIANQQIDTYKKQKEAQDQRVETEKATGTADMQKELAKAKVGVGIKTFNAEARVQEAGGEASYIQLTGEAEGARQKAIGVGKAEGYKAQVEALGQESTAFVNVVTSLSDKQLKFVPDVMVSGSGDALGGLAGVIMKRLLGDQRKEKVEEVAATTKK